MQVTDALHEILGEAVDPEAPLSQSGLDSLGALELRASLEQRMGSSLPATLLYDYPTAQQLAAFLQGSIAAVPDQGMSLQTAPQGIASPGLAPGNGPQAQTIGIVSLASRLPGGAPGNLDMATDCISSVPCARWDVEQHGMATSGTPATKWAAFLGTCNISGFDTESFGLSNAEAVLMDPQQRMLLGLAFELLQGRSQHSGKWVEDCGVFVGMYPPEYSVLVAESGAPVSAYHATGATSSAAAGRISYAFGLKGPCLSIDTACSSSLIGLHVGAAGILSGGAPQSAAFGINVLLNPEVLRILGAANMLSPRGRCAALDASADGYAQLVLCFCLPLHWGVASPTDTLCPW